MNVPAASGATDDRQAVIASADGGVRGWLGWFALAVIIGMQAGTFFEPLGSVGETRVADWLDLVTPYAVVGCAAMAMHRGDAGRSAWLLFGVGAVTFTLGHGLHLAANSVSNADDVALKEADIVHLWDEVVSHYIWYTGLFVMLAAIAVAVRAERLHLGVFDVVVAVAFTVTLVNTYIEGGVPWLGLVFLGSAAAASWIWRSDPVAKLLGLVGGLGLVLLVGWGLAWYVADGSVFPEFSDVGWI